MKTMMIKSREYCKNTRRRRDYIGGKGKMRQNMEKAKEINI
jgi:hypothetical protein